MSRKVYVVLFFLFICLFRGVFVYAEEYEYKDYRVEDIENNEIELRPGMELRKVGGINLIVPEGTEVYKRGARLIVEDTDEYAARRFKEDAARFEVIEYEQKEIKKKIDQNQEELERLKKIIKSLNGLVVRSFQDNEIIDQIEEEEEDEGRSDELVDSP